MQTSPVRKLMAFEALTLAIISPIHLIVGSYDAGLAEAVICLALLMGLARGGRAALAAVSFAIFGFLVGLTETVGGGSAIDLAYHATVLPMLIATALLLLPGREPSRWRMR